MYKIQDSSVEQSTSYSCMLISIQYIQHSLLCKPQLSSLHIQGLNAYLPTSLCKNPEDCGKILRKFHLNSADFHDTVINSETMIFN